MQREHIENQDQDTQQDHLIQDRQARSLQGREADFLFQSGQVVCHADQHRFVIDHHQIGVVIDIITGQCQMFFRFYVLHIACGLFVPLDGSTHRFLLLFVIRNRYLNTDRIDLQVFRTAHRVLFRSAEQEELILISILRNPGIGQHAEQERHVLVLLDLIDPGDQPAVDDLRI